MQPPASKRYHIIIDAFGCDMSKINDMPFIERFVVDIAAHINMNILKGPITAKGVDMNPGITCFAIVDFSHIAIHTFTDSDEFYLDIFSCRSYDTQKVVDFVKETFAIDDAQIRTTVVKNS